MSLTILHVEDDPLVADSVKEMLEAQGWRVISCVNGGAAMREFLNQTPFDLLITDNRLPDISGAALVGYVRQHLKERSTVPIIMFSGDDDAGSAYFAGVNMFLKKPAEGALLVSTIERLLQGA
ncbi:MAG TPA: response regulator [Pyrinomonadaceae bacterium]